MIGPSTMSAELWPAANRRLNAIVPPYRPTDRAHCLMLCAVPVFPPTVVVAISNELLLMLLSIMRSKIRGHTAREREMERERERSAFGYVSHVKGDVTQR